tara:strand:+ start:3144 stop:3401 length:258 start_codon:yes stop_codon:yes gene_type:complete
LKGYLKKTKEKIVKVEKNIPIPPKKSRAKNNYVPLLKAMEVGDSIVFDREEMRVNTFYVTAQRLGYKITVREIDDNQNRLWLLEK